MRARLALLVVAVLAGCASADRAWDAGSDAPERRYITAGAAIQAASYEDALASWRDPRDVNAWIGANFRYDFDRALALSESQRAVAPAPPILEPGAFFANPSGMCVDLARFAVETLRQVSPEANARYLMIEFEPTRIEGRVLRRHWVAVYDGAGGILVVGDSKRPGLLAGPFPTVDEFVADYAQFRGRRIVAYRELDSYQRRQRPRATRASADASR